MAEQKQQIVVTKRFFNDVIIEVDGKKYDVFQANRKKEYVKTVYGPIQNDTDKTVKKAYRILKSEKIGKLPLKVLKNGLKIKNISFFIEVLEDNQKKDNVLAEFEIGPHREGWITRDYQKMELITFPVNTGTYTSDNEVKFKFEYPTKAGKLLTKTKPLKK